VSIANSDGKTQLTAVLAVTSTGEYLAPQIYAKARQLLCHPQIRFPDQWDIWYTDRCWPNEETMERYIKNIVIPYISKREVLKFILSWLCLMIFEVQQLFIYHLLILAGNTIVPIQLPASCPDKLLPLNLSVNKPVYKMV